MDENVAYSIDLAQSVQQSMSAAEQSSALVGSETASEGLEAGLATMTSLFIYGGAGDLQRTYNDEVWDKTGDSIVNAFIDATSFYLGLVTQQAGLPLLAAEAGGGGVNALSHGIIDTLHNYQTLSNNGQNYNSINAGFTFGTQLGSGSSGSSYLQLADSSNSKFFFGNRRDARRNDTRCSICGDVRL